MNNLRRGVELISARWDVVTVSSVYETQAKGFSNQPTFFNAACLVRTQVNPFEMMHKIREVETTLGRHRSFINAPRILDIDILLFASFTICAPPVVLPHPRLAERSFALTPLVEIAPLVLHPTLNSTLTDLLFRTVGETHHVVMRSDRWGINL